MANEESKIIIRADASQAVSELTALRASVTSAYKNLDKAAESFKDLTKNQRDLGNVTKITSRLIEKLKNEHKALAPNQKKVTGNVKKQIDALKILNSTFATSKLRARAFARDMQGVGLAIRNSGKNLQFMGRSIMIGMLPFAGAIKKASDFARSLEQAEIRLAKVADLTKNELAPIADELEKISGQFGVSRDLITDIAADFAQVGFPADQLAGLTKAANQLSLLGDIDIGPAKDIFISTVFAMRNMAQLSGKTISFAEAVKQATGQMYFFNMIENNTALAIADLAESIPKLVPITSQFGMSITEASAALASMKASGVEAAEATTALRTGLLRLTSLTKQADDKVTKARATLKDFNFEAGVGIETLASFGDSITAIREQLSDAQAFDIVKNILGIRQTAKVNLFILDMEAASDQIGIAIKSLEEVGGTEVFSDNQISNINEFAKASRKPTEAMRNAAAEMIKNNEVMGRVNSQFLRGLIVQMSGLENATDMSIVELGKVLDSDAFKMKQAKNDIKNAMAEIGGTVNMMIVQHVLPVVKKWTKAFRGLSPTIQKLIIAVGALAASFGPVLYALAIIKMAFGHTLNIIAGLFFKIFSAMTGQTTAALAAANSQTSAIKLVQSAKASELATTLSLANANMTLAASRSKDASAALVGLGLEGKIGQAAHTATPPPAGSIAATRAAIKAKRKLAISNLLGSFTGRPSRTAAGTFKKRNMLAAAVFRARGSYSYTKAKGGAQSAADTVKDYWRNPVSFKPKASKMVQTSKIVQRGISGPLSKVKGSLTNFMPDKFIKVLSKAFGLFRKMLSPIKVIKTILASFNPWALAFVAIIGIVGVIFSTIKNNWDNFKKAAQPGIDALREAFGALKKAVGSVISALFSLFNRFSFGTSKAKSEGSSLGAFLGFIFKAIAVAINVVAKAIEVLAYIIKKAMDVVAPVLNLVLGLFSSLITMVKAVIALFKGDFSEAGALIKKAMGQAILAILGMWESAFGVLTGFIADYIDVWAWASRQVAKIPGMGWAGKIADEAESAADSVRNLDSTVFMPIKKGIAGMAGIEVTDLMHIEKENVRDIGKDAADAFSGGMEDELDANPLPTSDSGMYDATNAAEDAGAKAASAYFDAWTAGFKKFAGEIKKQLKKAMRGVKEWWEDAFDDQTKAASDAYTKQIDDIKALIKEEDRLSKEIAYQTKRREQIRDSALRNDAYRRNRALAIYEGRIDDARSLDLKEKRAKEDAGKSLIDLDLSRSQEILSMQRADNMERIADERATYEESRRLMKQYFDDQLSDVFASIPNSEEAWGTAMDTVGVILDGAAEHFGTTVDDIVGENGFIDTLKTKFTPANIFETAIASAKKALIETYLWEPALSGENGMMSWLFDAFEEIEGKIVDWETKIKEWRTRLEAAWTGGPSSGADDLTDSERDREWGWTATTPRAPIPRMSDSELDREWGWVRTYPGVVTPEILSSANVFPEPPPEGRSVVQDYYDLQKGLLAPATFWSGLGAKGLGWVWDRASDLWGDEQGGSAIGPASRGGALLDGDEFAALIDDTVIDNASRGGGSRDVQGLSPKLKGVHSSLAKGVIEMANEAWDKERLTMWVSSGMRPMDRQIELFKKHYSKTSQSGAKIFGKYGDRFWDGSWWSHKGGNSPEVAVPGKSMHGRGEAVDISGPDNERDRRWAFMDKFSGKSGIWTPLAHEPWHHTRKPYTNIDSFFTGGMVGGAGSASQMIMAHGQEFVMKAAATRRIGMSTLNNMNNYARFVGPNSAGGGTTNNSSSNVNIYVDTFVGQREWFESMMSDYNVNIAPSSERVRGVENRTIGSYVDQNKRSRV